MTINVRGKLFDLSQPQVMGILNVTPDSFYADSRKQTEADIRQRVEEIVSEGGTMIDLGAYSTRPGASDIPPQEEMRRLALGMSIIHQAAPHLPVSIDTFRADVARMAIEELGADIINDISGGGLDPQMFHTVSRLGVPYILTYNHVDPSRSPNPSPTAGKEPENPFCYFSAKIQSLRDLGQKDIILDPGYGFAKTIEQNYALLRHQEDLRIFNLPLLVGISRKSMIYRPLGITPQDALLGTTVLHTIALMKGANILRVHDVKACVETIKLFTLTIKTPEPC